ncbi:MAG: hypothetical protein KKD00_00980 [Gammaproteobacteria bacterium]|nr:hypothetical protein [Gammaproteobacteria bacterium]
MSCPHLAETIANHFEELLSPTARTKHQQHLAGCLECRQEIAALGAVPGVLEQWQTQSVPEWNRVAIMRPQSGRKSLPHRHSRWLTVSDSFARWAPLAAAVVLAVAVLAQTRLDVSDSGWSLSFGQPSAALDSAQLTAYLARQAELQQAETRQWVEAALRTHGEATADSVYQWMSWMEQQRELDIQRMEAGFEQLLDRDFQTVDSMRQLASYVMFQETP